MKEEALSGQMHIKALHAAYNFTAPTKVKNLLILFKITVTLFQEPLDQY